MVVGQLVRVPVLFLVLHLEGHRGAVGLGLVGAEPNPLLLEALFVLEVVLHVGEDHVPGGDVHGGGGRLLLPVELSLRFEREKEKKNKLKRKKC